MGSGGSGSRRLRFDSQGEFPRGPRFLLAARDGAHPAAGDPAFQTAVDSAIQNLLRQQHSAGYWLDETHTGGASETEYLLLLAWLNRLDTPEARQCARTVEAAQLPAGGWAAGTELPGFQTDGGAASQVDIGLSVRAWLALRLAGHDPAAEHMQRARRAIRLRGGAEGISGLTKCWLAMLGQIAWSQCPVLLPEELQLPGWLPLGQGELPRWSQSVLLPVSIVRACRAVRQPPGTSQIEELFLTAPELMPAHAAGEKYSGSGSWRMKALERTLRLADRLRLTPFRRHLIRRSLGRLKSRRRAIGSTGGIRAAIWQIAAQVATGADPQSARIEQSLADLSRLLRVDETTQQAHLSWVQTPVADTAQAVLALRESGVPAES
ncbi:MAG: hypothetical protein KDA79_12665, partial [Planctomycetaceae bacterium]|nr:hypothetical protein [Planctomycetaceae bacterium]